MRILMRFIGRAIRGMAAMLVFYLLLIGYVLGGAFWKISGGFGSGGSFVLFIIPLILVAIAGGILWLIVPSYVRDFKRLYLYPPEGETREAQPSATPGGAGYFSKLFEDPAPSDVLDPRYISAVDARIQERLAEREIRVAEARAVFNAPKPQFGKRSAEPRT